MFNSSHNLPTRAINNTISRASKMSIQESPTKTPYLRKEVPPSNTRDQDTQLILAVLWRITKILLIFFNILTLKNYLFIIILIYSWSSLV
jgi:hypothetical protein